MLVLALISHTVKSLSIVVILIYIYILVYIHIYTHIYYVCICMMHIILYCNSICNNVNIIIFSSNKHILTILMSFVFLALN